MADQAWQLYDFDANWPIFLEIWKSAPIQSVLKPHIDQWCIGHANTDGNGNRPSWSEGDPLWQLSRTDFWDLNINDSIDTHINTHRYVENLQKTWRMNLTRPNCSRHQATDAMYEIMRISGEYKRLYDLYSPKPDTIESLILVLGKNHMSHALFHVAHHMFPHDDIIFTIDKQGHDVILIPALHTVFDLFDFFYDKYELVENMLKPDAVYDEMVERFVAYEAGIEEAQEIDEARRTLFD
jgi:hypothetical protein